MASLAAHAAAVLKRPRRVERVERCLPADDAVNQTQRGAQELHAAVIGTAA
jgi:hypothetical protein